MAKTYGQHCPVALTLDIIGERWTMLIIRDLYFGVSRFSDLVAASPGMSSRILSERLRLLEQHGLVERRPYRESPRRDEYVLTDKGLSLEPVLNAIGEWAGSNLLTRKDARALLARIESRRPRRRAPLSKSVAGVQRHRRPSPGRLS